MHDSLEKKRIWIKCDARLSREKKWKKHLIFVRQNWRSQSWWPGDLVEMVSHHYIALLHDSSLSRITSPITHTPQSNCRNWAARPYNRIGYLSIPKRSQNNRMFTWPLNNCRAEPAATSEGKLTQSHDESQIVYVLRWRERTTGNDSSYKRSYELNMICEWPRIDIE